MSEYYLADTKAAERARQRQREREPTQEKPKADNIKVTLLGDFLFASSDPQGCDPYNSLHGQSAREAWRTRRERD
jgi:hypothetical protein